MQPKKLSGGVRFLLGFLSLILCVVLFVSTLASMLVANAQLILTKDNMKAIVSQILFSMDAPAAPVRPAPLAAGVHTGRLDDAMPDFGDMSMEDMENPSAITEMVYGMLQEQFGEDVPLSYEAVEEFIEESTLTEFMSEKVAGIVSDIVTGESTTTITGEEIAQLIEENSQLIKDTFDVEITQEMVQDISSWVEENDIMSSVTEIVSKELGPIKGGNTYEDDDIISGTAGALEGAMSGDLSAILALVRIFTSNQMLFSCIGVCAVLIVLLLVINIKQLHTGLKWIGVPLMLAGLFASIPVIITYAIPSMFVGPLAIVTTVLQITAPVTLGVCVGGIVLLIVGIVLGSRFKKKLRAAAVAAAQAEPVIEVVPEVQMFTQPMEAAPVEAVPVAEAPAEEATSDL